jgi:hypothetical protein
MQMHCNEQICPCTSSDVVRPLWVPCALPLAHPYGVDAAWDTQFALWE